MLSLSAETEELARRLAEISQQSVDETIRDALRACEKLTFVKHRKDMSPEAMVARRGAVRRIVAEMAALPILDPRPVQEIVDEINEI